MTGTEIGIISLVCLIPLLIIGLPIAGIFFLLGVGGLTFILDLDKALSLLAQTLYHSVATPNWAAMPLFILMGSLAASGGFAQKAFNGLNTMTRGITGAVGIATCYSCAFFGSICGSAAATGAIFARLAIPEMRRLGYDKSLAAGIVASAGTFATMIPPSGLMIVYCLLTQQSIGRLFAAGVIPGMLTATLYAVSIYARIKLNPDLVKTDISEPPVTTGDRLFATIDVFPLLFIAFIVSGGIYGGIFTPTEAAAVGCIVILGMGVFYRTLNNRAVLRDALRTSAMMSAMIFIVIIGALFFSRYLALTQVPTNLSSWVAALEVPRFVILLGILGIWFVMGIFMLPDGIFALSLPLTFPLIVNLGYDPIWFGIVAMKLSEIANVTPPVGLNIFALQGVVDDDVKVTDIYKGVWPFIYIDVAVLVALIVFPDIALFLPNLIFG